MITIIDYKVGNLGSIKNMLKKIGVQSIITSKIEDVQRADKLILPGVGSFDNGVLNLKDLGIWEMVEDKVRNQNTPILGICLGAQLMTKGSEEGQEAGFGWVDSKTVKFKFPADSRLKVPSMGWNDAKPSKASRLLEGFEETLPRFYFVHSFHFEFNNPAQVLTESNYGYNFVSAFEKDNILGVQFHPEKSHKYGMQLLKNFAEKY